MFKKSVLLLAIMLFAFSVAAAQEETEPANESAITGTRVPKGALRILPSSMPDELHRAFENLATAGKGKLVAGEREVLAWTNNYKKSNVPALIAKLQTEWRGGGWQYEASGRDGNLEVFGLFTENPTRRAVLGFFVEGDEALVLGLMEVTKEQNVNVKADAPRSFPKNSGAENNSAAKVLNVGKDEAFVNVMGNEMPEIPSFPALKPKAGFVRGYVKDWTGKPLEGATLGVRSSYLAGMYSGAQGKTDAKGYYEFAVPKGSAHFYNAGYAIEWSNGTAALGLHPADGELESFVTMDGAVENFVLLPYGLTSRANVQENPFIAASYYGGSIRIGYYTVGKDDNNQIAGSIVEDSILEITLTPEGDLSAGFAGKPFIIRHKVGFRGNFYIHNIPLGRYRIGVKINGKAAKLKDSDTYDQSFGMLPRETTQTANLVFVPDSPQAKMVSPQAGGWNAVSITVEP